MSDKVRWRHGQTNPVVASVDSATVIEIGDLVWQDTDDVKPASTLLVDKPDQLAANITPDVIAAIDDALGTPSSSEEMQEKFASNFLGVAMQRSRSGDADLVRISTTGVFEFDCPIGTFELGDVVGACETDDGDALENQKVKPVSTAGQAIGRIAVRAASPTESVLVDIRSTVMTGGV